MRRLKKKNVIIIVCSLVILAIIVVFAFVILNNKSDMNGTSSQDESATEEPIKKLQIINEDSNSRPYAVMINNHPQARAHHAGLQDAYIIYEMIVEGGLTRYLALFKDQDTEKIGSVRSSRHYFLDYALENDAIYVHWGYSPQAQSDIKSLNIDNIDGLVYEGKYFYRDRSLGVATEHTGFTTMEFLKEATEKLKYRDTSNQDTLLNYTTDVVDLSSKEDSVVADEVTIKYSSSVTDKYVYDSTLGVYKRYVNGKEHVDDVTKEQYTFKNIITYQVENDTISGDDKGRQEFYNVGEGTGYYITNGYAIKIKWSKKDRSSQTKYTYLNGEEIEVNDGNTFIQIQPKNQKLEIKENNENNN